MQEQDVRQLSPSYPLVRERERNPRVHTLDAAWKRGEGSNSAEDTDGINYSVSISMPPGFHSFPFPADSH